MVCDGHESQPKAESLGTNTGCAALSHSRAQFPHLQNEDYGKAPLKEGGVLWPSHRGAHSLQPGACLRPRIGNEDGCPSNRQGGDSGLARTTRLGIPPQVDSSPPLGRQAPHSSSPASTVGSPRMTVFCTNCVVG